MQRPFAILIASLISVAAVAPPRSPSLRSAIFEVTPRENDAARDLPGIERMFAGHRFIGLGEATHGTHEIFELKSRIVTVLVTRGDVRAIAFESSFGSTLAASDYVNLVGVHGGDKPGHWSAGKMLSAAE